MSVAMPIGGSPPRRSAETSQVAGTDRRPRGGRRILRKEDDRAGITGVRFGVQSMGLAYKRATRNEPEVPCNEPSGHGGGRRHRALGALAPRRRRRQEERDPHRRRHAVQGRQVREGRRALRAARTPTSSPARPSRCSTRARTRRRTRSRSSRRRSCPRASSSPRSAPLMAAHQVDPNNEEAPPGVLKVDNGAAAADQNAPLQVDSLGDDKQAGDSEFIAPGQKKIIFQVTARRAPCSRTTAPSTRGCRARSASSSPLAAARSLRGLAALVLPALVVVLAPPPPTPRRATCGSRPCPRTGTRCPTRATRSTARASPPPQTTFPTVVYRRYTRGWKRPLRLAYEARRAADHRPADPRARRRRAADPLQEPRHAARRRPHSMHFHGVEYEPSSDGVYLPLHSGKGGA